MQQYRAEIAQTSYREKADANFPLIIWGKLREFKKYSRVYKHVSKIVCRIEPAPHESIVVFDSESAGRLNYFLLE